MILNAFAQLDGAVSLLRLGLAWAIVWLAIGALRGRRNAAADVEDRCHLLFLLGGLLLSLEVLAWPLFYLLLQSYVSEWPGVMCIYGVTRVGTGSLNSSRFLPPLLATLQASKPLLVFLSGAWLALHLVNRRTRTAPLTGRVVALLLAAGVVAAVDASLELAYLAIPKKEVFLSAGCCTAVFDSQDGPSRFVPRGLLSERAEPWLWAGYYAVNAGVVVGLLGAVRAGQRGRPMRLAPLFAAAGLGLAVNAAFLVQVAAPRLLHLPGHHCPYDLVGQAPRSLAGVALSVSGALFVGWGCVAGWLGDVAEARPFLAATVGSLFRLAAFAYLFSVVLISVELSVA